MDLFESIINELNINGSNNASVSQKKITDAIKNHWASVIRYSAGSDKDKKHTKKRLIMPVAYGMSKAGNDVIRAYQTQGDTNTFIPKWKFFRTDRILSWENKKATNFDTRLLANAEEKYNASGDKSMSQVYIQAKPGKKNAKTVAKKRKSSSDITYKPITKQDINNLSQPTSASTPSTSATTTAITTTQSKSTAKNIDNISKKYYNSLKNNDKDNNALKLSVPDTNPITKKDINYLNNVQNNELDSSNTDNDNEINSYSDEFISQQDIKDLNNSQNNNEKDEVSALLKEWNKRLKNIL